MKLRKLSGLLLFTLVFGFTPSAIAADTNPPQLVDWSLVERKADISTKDATVTVRFIVSDDSEIVTPILLLKSLSTTQLTSFAQVRELSRSGKLVSYEASAVIRFGASPKVWEWVLYPLRDTLGNISSSFGPGNNWISQISVIDLVFTDDLLQCQNVVKNWNLFVEKFQNSEKKYLGAQEFAVVRLKFRIPIELIDPEGCGIDSFRIKYMNPFSPSNLISATADLATTWANTSNNVSERIARENELKQAELEKTAAELKAKQEAEAKAAAELKAKQDAASKAAAQKKTTITCIKGKLTKKVTAVSPKCPTGYKERK